MVPTAVSLILCIGFFLVPMLALFAAKGMVALLAVLALVALINGRKSLFVDPLGPFTWTCLAGLGLALISALWAKAGLGHAPAQAAKVASLAFAGWLVARCFSVGVGSDLSQRLGLSAIAGCLVAAAVIVLEVKTNGLLHRNLEDLRGFESNIYADYRNEVSAAAIVLALWIWPGVLLIWRRRPVIAAIGLIGAAVGAVLGPAQVATLVLLASGVVAVAAYFRPRLTAWFCTVTIALCTVAAPYVPQRLPDPRDHAAEVSYLSNSALHRLLIWQNAARLIEEQPILGIGFDGTRRLYTQADRIDIDMATDLPERTWKINVEPIPLHPHNQAIQVRLELGIPGVLMLIGLVVAAAGLIGKGRTTAVQPARLASLTGILLIGALSFSAWQSWWIALIALICAFTNLHAQPTDRDQVSA